MGDNSWFSSDKIEFNILMKDPLNVIPSSRNTYNENVNRISLIILYIGLFSSLLTGELIFLLGALVLMFVVGFGSNQMKKSAHLSNCQEPRPNNPLMNVLLTDYTQDPTRPGACNSSLSKNLINQDLFANFNIDENDVNMRNNSQRQFFSTANTQIPNDRDAFTTYLYGARNQPYCKTNPSICTGRESGQRGGGRPNGAT
ncbi:MAG: hypothetical protein CMM25_04745 [Rhodospirillaceae bacterium]|nr:hypothetical protein [Rhodospirillaceae bacterium]|tara:strand:+ start:511 stop:1110 length:600 start_codon:yes stop_codon:yes gene_type:complete